MEKTLFPLSFFVFVAFVFSGCSSQNEISQLNPQNLTNKVFANHNTSEISIFRVDQTDTSWVEQHPVVLKFESDNNLTLNMISFLFEKDDPLEDPLRDLIVHRVVNKREEARAKLLSNHNSRYHIDSIKWYEYSRFDTSYFTKNSRPTLHLKWNLVDGLEGAQVLTLYSDSLNFSCKYKLSTPSSTTSFELKDPHSNEVEYCPLGRFELMPNSEIFFNPNEEELKTYLEKLNLDSYNKLIKF